MPRPKGSKNIPWARIVERLRQQPGVWMSPPELRAVPQATVRVIRRRERAVLRMDDGVILVRQPVRNQTESGVTCTLFLKFQPKESP